MTDYHYRNLLLNLINYVEYLQPKNSYDTWDGKKFFTNKDISCLPGFYIQPEEDVWLSANKILNVSFPKIPKELKVAINHDSKKPLLEPNIKSYQEYKEVINKNTKKNKECLAEKDYDVIQKKAQKWIKTIWIPWSIHANKNKEAHAIYNNLFNHMVLLKNEGESENKELIFGFGSINKIIHNKNGQKIIEDFGPIIIQSCEIKLSSQYNDIVEIVPSASPLEVRWDIIKKITHHTDEIKKWFFQTYDLKTIDFPIKNIEKNHFLNELIDRIIFNFEYIEDNNDRQVQYKVSKNNLKSNENNSNNTYFIDMSNNWSIYLRKRPNNRMLNDIVSWKNEINNIKVENNIPWYIKAMVNKKLEFFYKGSSKGISSQDNQNYFFPLAYNEEQLNILYNLKNGPGTIVQGPPGTGKSHTIANIISHYLAEGKNILVTSSSAGTLEVIKDKLPKEIRMMTVSLLSSDSDSLKSFDKNISDIEYKLSTFNKQEKIKEINSYKESINNINDEIFIYDKNIKDIFENKTRVIHYKDEAITYYELSKKLQNKKEQLQQICSIDETEHININETKFEQIKKYLEEIIEIKKSLYKEIETIKESIKNHKSFISMSNLNYDEYIDKIFCLSNKGDLNDDLLKNDKNFNLYHSYTENNKNILFADKLLDELLKSSLFLFKEDKENINKEYKKNHIQQLINAIPKEGIKNIEEQIKKTKQKKEELNSLLEENPSFFYIKEHLENQIENKLKNNANELFDIFNKITFIQKNIIEIKNTTDKIISKKIDIPLSILTNEEQKEKINTYLQSFNYNGLLQSFKRRKLYSNSQKTISKISINSETPSTQKDWHNINKSILVWDKYQNNYQEWLNIESYLGIRKKSNRSFSLNIFKELNHFLINELLPKITFIKNTIKLHIRSVPALFITLNNNYGLITDQISSYKNLSSIEKAISSIITFKELHEKNKKWLSHIFNYIDNPVGHILFEGFFNETKDAVNYSSGHIKNFMIKYQDNDFWRFLSDVMSVYHHIQYKKCHLDENILKIKNILNSNINSWLSLVDKVVSSQLPEEMLIGYWEYLLYNHLLFQNNEDINKILDKKKILEDKRKSYELMLITEKIWLGLHEKITPKEYRALRDYVSSINKQGSGKGLRSFRYRASARKAMRDAFRAIGCWIMPHGRVCETFPAEIGLFDLVIIDEASQSNIQALPSLLRGKKLLVVGDDKQVSPSSMMSEKIEVKYILNKLINQQPYKDKLLPEFSIYDLFNVIFANHSVMLREHFRSVQEIITYSNHYYYHNRIIPLRFPSSKEKLHYPLVDVLIKNSFYKNKINEGEADFIIKEIQKLLSDDKTKNKTIGIITLPSSSDKQQKLIKEKLSEVVDQKYIISNQIIIGPPPVFQGKEKDIIFISVMWDGRKSKNGRTYEPPLKESFKQRFNVALSRARDRMYLVRSNAGNPFKPNGLLYQIEHYFKNNVHLSMSKDNKSSDSDNHLLIYKTNFEKDLYNDLLHKGYRVYLHLGEKFSYIDLCIEGDNNLRMGIQCEGDRPEKETNIKDILFIKDKLDRTGWLIWYMFAADYYSDRNNFLKKLTDMLQKIGINPINNVKDSQILLKKYRQHKFKHIEYDFNKSLYHGDTYNNTTNNNNNSNKSKTLSIENNNDWLYEIQNFIKNIKKHHTNDLNYDDLKYIRNIENHLNQNTLMNDQIKKLLKEYPWPKNKEEWPQHKDLLTLLCDSPFEKEVLLFLLDKKYTVRPQYKVHGYYIDMVMLTNNNNMVAIECDGDSYHNLSNLDLDNKREEYIKKMNNVSFWRCYYSDWSQDKDNKKQELINFIRSV